MIAADSLDRSGVFDLAWLFLRLGITAFGGPAAHIAMMEQEVVRNKKWISHEEFLDLLGATNLIPGPNSTEMASHIGYRRAGWLGLMVAGISFIAPAFLIVLSIAYLYVHFGKLPQIQGILYGVKPAVIAIIAQALWTLSHTAIKNKLLGFTAILCAAAYTLGMPEIFLLIQAGVFVALIFWITDKSVRDGKHIVVLGACVTGILLFLHVLQEQQVGAVGFSLKTLFWYFVKIGSVLYGSGYVLLAFLRTDLVERWHWLTSSQLLTATAIGQVTPGPVFTTATFIGYLLGGPAGACIGTIGIFLPAFIFVAISGFLVPRIRRSRLAGAFLDGVNVASLVLMAAVTFQLAFAAIPDISTFALLCASALAIFRFKTNSIWVILSSGIVGVLLNLAPVPGAR